MNMYDYVGRLDVWGTWARDTTGYMRHQMNKHDYVGRLDVWDTKWIGMIMRYNRRHETPNE